jgi:hypothetical protein
VALEPVGDQVGMQGPSVWPGEHQVVGVGELDDRALLGLAAPMLTQRLEGGRVEGEGCSSTARMPRPPPKASPALRKIPNSTRLVIGPAEPAWSAGRLIGWSSPSPLSVGMVRLPAAARSARPVAGSCDARGQAGRLQDELPHHVVVSVFQQTAMVRVGPAEPSKLASRPWSGSSWLPPAQMHQRTRRGSRRQPTRARLTAALLLRGEMPWTLGSMGLASWY